MKSSIFKTECLAYLAKLSNSFSEEIYTAIESLSLELKEAWLSGNQVFICGNGGSAANAIHIANDLIYGVGACGLGEKIPGIKVEALSSNSGVLTCIANDTGYENIYSEQIKVSGKPGDLLILLSGSGNSKNIINAINIAKKMKINTFGIFGYNGGKSKKIVDEFIHTKIDDMQISEDMQLVIFHMCMQLLKKK